MAFFIGIMILLSLLLIVLQIYGSSKRVMATIMLLHDRFFTMEAVDYDIDHAISLQVNDQTLSIIEDNGQTIQYVFNAYSGNYYRQVNHHGTSILVGHVKDVTYKVMQRVGVGVNIDVQYGRFSGSVKFIATYQEGIPV
jgi:hypothetical protein